jgi:hypothetical protein
LQRRFDMTREEFRQMTKDALDKIEEQLERIAWDETLLAVNDNYTAQAVGRLLREIAEYPDDYAALFDDNGAEPDGTAYVIPAEHLTRRDALIVVHCGLMEAVVGDILDGYDGSEEVRAWMDEHYPRGWSGYSSRDEAYGIAYTFEEMTPEERENWRRYKQER